MTHASTHQNTLLFSIVIPTYNRPDRLVNCLQSIANLDFPRDRFEVIVVDDGSQDPMEPVASPFHTLLNLTLIRQPNAGPANARNNGAAHAKGTYLVFTDDDCMPTATWLRALEQEFSKAPNCLIGGRTLNALPQNLYSTTSQLLIDYLYSHYNSTTNTPNFFASNNFALPTQAFHKLGGFDTSFPLAAGEDREFCDRWLQHGYCMSYAPEMQIQHAHMLSLRAFWRQHFNYGRGAFCFHTVRAQRQSERIKVEPITFYIDLLTYPFRHAPANQKLGIALLLFVSQVANVAGFFWERLNQPSASLQRTT